MRRPANGGQSNQAGRSFKTDQRVPRTRSSQLNALQTRANFGIGTPGRNPAKRASGHRHLARAANVRFAYR
jgi:hypothetical protein